ncbi:cyclodeaminase/cyclohydrolase family protein [Alkalibacterium olivapovliticus]|uniref:Formiminotetrahydrofolate cyclodeaminase n=1 Tax=Alkalibacterium olivapovliticus TaxID=99907 RepID=A0A2T0W5C0_9LACT|nr:cyclodeaminase/cyclohydrolase family protein [Alkalibacterium olivapovliticus]MCC5895359.1 cyclodeaminase/cyclohydrolase family protein [Alkalibacterium sp.]PRY80968.1 formiminotetrahydrofolate cyclodeaminase [Alkalibacterium olivapovliticus]
MNELTIEHYLTELGKKEGTPGGGSAAAYIGSMSAALIRMVADIQKDKKKYTEHADDIKQVLDQAQSARSFFEQLAKDDAVAFEPVLMAYKLPKETPGEKEIRQEAVEKAIRGAAQPPLTMLDKSHELIGLLEQLTRMKMSGTIINDLMVAALFIETVLETAVLNVTINTKLLSDEAERVVIEDKAFERVASGKKKVQELRETINYFLEKNEWPDSL